MDILRKILGEFPLERYRDGTGRVLQLHAVWVVREPEHTLIIFEMLLLLEDNGLAIFFQYVTT